MTVVEVALRFIEAINARDVRRLVALLTEDHRFIDSLGHTLEGRALTRPAWESYFQMVPDYSIRVTETFERDGVVVLLGTARGSLAAGGRVLADSAWQTPAAWRVVVREDGIAEWRVYADNEPIREILRRTSR